MWENVFVDVTFYRRTAESRGEPYDPLWVEWEDEARGILGLSDATYVDESYQIVDDRGGSSTAVTSASKPQESASRPGSEADD